MVLSNAYPYTRADGVAVASPLFQVEGGGSSPTSALQLHFERIPIEDACGLNALWHSLLPRIHGGAKSGPLVVCYGALYDGCYYAAAIWSTPPAVNRMRWALDEVLELRRFAIAPQAPKNTASRMLAWMARDVPNQCPSVSTLVSYQDREYHRGTIYKAAGWTPSKVSEFKPWTNRRSGRRVVSVTTGTISDKVRWELTVKGNKP